MTLIEISCPICGASTKTLPRYPRRVCDTCAAKASAVTPTRRVSAESSLSRSPTSPNSDSRSPFTPHPRPCTRPPIPRACLAFRWPYPLSVGLAPCLLAQRPTQPRCFSITCRGQTSRPATPSRFRRALSPGISRSSSTTSQPIRRYQGPFHGTSR